MKRSKELQKKINECKFHRWDYTTKDLLHTQLKECKLWEDKIENIKIQLTDNLYNVDKEMVCMFVDKIVEESKL